MTNRLCIIVYKKHKAEWLGSYFRVLHQLLMSIISFLTMPFAKYHDNAVFKYFYKTYYEKDDPLIFDGKDLSYFELCKLVLNISELKERNIIDIGCGKGSLYKWLIKNSIDFKYYLGIDIAYESKILSGKANIIKCDIGDIVFPQIDCMFIYFINTLCYLSDSKLDYILSNCSKATDMLIIDPIPSLFWDAHFENIKLYYRKITEVTKILEFYKWDVIDVAIDYGVKIKEKYLFPLSYCLYAKRQGNNNVY